MDDSLAVGEIRIYEPPLHLLRACIGHPDREAAGKLIGNCSHIDSTGNRETARLTQW